MNGERPDIEWIVAEVVRRLEQRARRPERPPEPPVAAAASPISSVDPSAVVLDCRLVTLAALEGRLDGARRLLVPQGAVVTPAVKDELRARDITLETRARAHTSSDSERGALHVVCCNETAEAGRLAAALIAAAALPTESSTDLAAAVRELAGQAGDHRAAWILLTDQPLAGVCLANRHATLRAAAGVTAREAAQAVELIAANLLVVDPRQVTAVEWQQMIRQFGQALPRTVPASFQP
jgi:hypothetical protein